MMFFMDGAVHRQSPHFLNEDWVLLDSQSTVHVIFNKKYLRNIRPAPEPLRLHCNAGVKQITHIGEFPSVGTVWYDANGIANIFSMAKLAETFKIEYDSSAGNKFVVTNPQGRVREFIQSPTGLYYFDLRSLAHDRSEKNASTASGESAGVFINTVESNKIKYTNRDYLRALKCRKLQNIVGPPSNKDFTSHLEGPTITNCPFNREDIRAAENILGPSLKSLKGKTTRKRSQQVRIQRVAIPPSLMEKYRKVTLAIDVMKVNKLPFFVTVATEIKLGTAEVLVGMSDARLLTSMKKVYKAYRTRGFRITHIKADGEFESLRGDFAEMKMALNTVSRDEHVPEIERQIRTVKERCRGHYNTLPFRSIPLRMLIELVYNAIFWLNSFPPLGGISKTISPRELVFGGKIDYNKHCKYEFGEYVQTHEEHDNSMATRTIGALALRPNGNLQGGHLFLSLSTGRVIDRKNATPLPMPNEVIDRIHRMARQQKAQRELVFTDRNNIPYIDEDDDEDSDDDDDSTYASDDDSISDDENDDDDDDYDANIGRDDELAPPTAPTAVPTNDVENAGVNQAPPMREDVIPDDDTIEKEITGVPDTSEIPGVQQPAEIQAVEPTGTPGVPEEPIEITGVPPTESTNEDITPELARERMEEKYGKRTGRYNLRQRKPRSYAHLHAQMNEDAVIRHIFTQLNMKQGIKQFGQAGINAILKEMKQLHERKVGTPVKASSLTSEDKNRCLNYLMFLKQKRCGLVKGRGCADGRKQRLWKTKEETASPTVINESIFITSTIDAKERRDVATCDIPGAFMQADIDERLHVRLEGKMAELLTRIAPETYEEFLEYDPKGKAYMYLLLDKALYGTVQAALLFWKKLSAKLQDMGFTLNPYDPCVANKVINGKQCTIVWHVDDMKISHVQSTVVDSILVELKKEYGSIGELTVTRGKKHEYLGMTLDFTIPGKVQITMFDYIVKMLTDLPPSMQGTAATPAADHLFKVNLDAIKLDPADADFFHTMVAKSLFLSKRARPDIQTAVAFLCTRVKAPDRDDYKKLARLMNYLRATKDIPLTLEWDGLNIVRWWADASFATHADMKGHTGGVMSMGKGAVISVSRKQRLNSRSSTETELIGADDMMPVLLWSINFIRAQGYEVDMARLYQDNKSTMLFEKNGQKSSSKRTRHLNIRYFFITDQIAKGNLTVEHCPTGDMIADFYTKPLQGAQFRRFRDMIMNIQK